MLREFLIRRLAKRPNLLAMARFARRTGVTKIAELYSFWQILQLANAQQYAEAYERIRYLAENSQDIPPALSDIAYNVFDAFLRLKREALPVFPEYERFGIYQGIMPSHLLDALMTEVREAPAGGQSLTDFHPDYHYNYNPISVAAVQSIHSFVDFDAQQRQRLSHIFSLLQAPIEQCLGIPGRVLNLKAWWTPPGAKDTGMNEWHTDGFPNEICKLMVYPFGANMDAGTTQFRYPNGSERHIEGPPGVYAIFKNSAIVHRGIASKRENRLVVELTIGPSPTIDWRMASGGPLSTYPKLPWADLPR
ncbi:MAG: hypothetical protein ACREOR_02590 [Candidatus Binatia bacterium]